jgi:hypothetical protein
MKRKNKKQEITEEKKILLYWEIPGQEEDIPTEEKPYELHRRKRPIPNDAGMA